MASGASSEAPYGFFEQPRAASGFAGKGGTRGRVGLTKIRIRNPVQRGDIGDHRCQIRTRQRCSERYHARTRDAARHDVIDVHLIEATARHTRSAARCAPHSVAVSRGAGFRKHLFAPLYRTLRPARHGQEERRSEEFHRDPSGSANTTSVDPSRQSWSGNKAIAAPPTTETCHPVDVAMYCRPLTAYAADPPR